jgi:hypothetical protein
MKTVDEVKGMLNGLLAADTQGLNDLVKEVEVLRQSAMKTLDKDESKKAMIFATEKLLKAQSAIISVKTRIDTYRFLLQEIEK